MSPPTYEPNIPSAVPLITLTTDFGDKDAYVACMKAVLLSLSPNCRMVDVCHHVAPQDIPHGAYTIWSAFSLFPAKTVHLVVVDPGVGSGRKAIAAQAHGQFFVGPDNGVLWPILSQDPQSQIHQITESRWFRSKASATFHGRDIFAPVAAYTALGVPLQEFGPPVQRSELVSLELFDAQRNEQSIVGKVLLADHFGNLATNIPADLLPPPEHHANCKIEIGHTTVTGICHTFADVGLDQPVAYVNSFGVLEVAVRNASAQAQFSAFRNQPVMVQW